MCKNELNPIVILLTGVSGSGKSTAANALKSRQTHVIRGDLLFAKVVFK